MKYTYWIFICLLCITCKPDANEEKSEVQVEKMQKIQNGQELFKAGCAPCHDPSLVTDATGPALANVHKYRSRKWLRRFTRNSQYMIASGDSLALCLWEQWKPTVMNEYLKPNKKLQELGAKMLSDEDIDLIYDFIAHKSQTENLKKEDFIMECEIKRFPPNMDKVKEEDYTYSYGSPFGWNSKLKIKKKYYHIGYPFFEKLEGAVQIEVGVKPVIRATSVCVLFPKNKAVFHMYRKEEHLYDMNHHTGNYIAFPVGIPAILIAHARDGEYYWFGYKKINYGAHNLEELLIEKRTKIEVEKILDKLL